MTGGCQCGAIRYALFAAPEATVCHCRMCQKAVGGPFAALSKVQKSDFAWTRGQPGTFRSSAAARDFRAACGTPLTFRYLNGDAIEVTTGSLDHPEGLRPVSNFGSEARVPRIGELLPGRLPDRPTPPGGHPGHPVISRQHPDRETPDEWVPPG